MTYKICIYCNKQISSSNYSKHIRGHENGNYDKYTNKNGYHLDHDDLFCKFCHKELKNKHALRQHECRCKLNPNKIDTSVCFGHKNGVTIWNKGLNKIIDDRIAKYSNNISKTLKNKLIIHIHKEHNDLEINKWINYINSLNITIPKYETKNSNKCGKYIEVKDNEFRFEHDYLMNIILNNQLASTNTVHHIDGNGSNNSLTNLLVFETKGYHNCFHHSELAYLEYNENTHKFKCYKK